LVSTNTGRQFTGIKVRQTKTELVLRTAEDKEISIPVRDIEDQTPGGSLMPEGLTDPLTRAELIDLVRFLSELGKVGPYAVGKGVVVRCWQTLEALRENQDALTHRGVEGAIRNDAGLLWTGAYSTVAGSLPLANLPQLEAPAPGKRVTVVRCQLNVTTPGLTRLQLPNVDGLRLWLDGNAIQAQPTLDVNLSEGCHIVTAVVEVGARRHKELRCEIEEIPGSRGRIRPVLGK
jgi:hypothetical protein